MRASAEPVEGNRVRLSVEVEESEVDQAVDSMIRSLSRQARVPGFRPGKVPRKVLEARMGGLGVIRGEALREALPDFYAQAVLDARLDPITPPEIELKAGEDAGPVAFEALVEVRPTIQVPGYTGLVVTVPRTEVSDEEVEEQIDRLRETDAELEPVSRAARDGDQVTVNIHGSRADGQEFPGVDDYVYEVGSATVVPELDDELRGSGAGAVLAFHATVDDVPTSFQVLVKKVQEKVLPELTDEWVEENTDAATVEDLRREIADRLRRLKVLRARAALRDGVVSALADLVDDEAVPAVLVEEEANQRLEDLDRRLRERGASLAELLEASGQSADEVAAQARIEATQAVKADLALRAVADAEDLDVGDEEFDAELVATAERLGTSAPELRRRLDAAGRTGALRAEQRKGKALSWLVDHVQVVDEEGRAVDRSALELPEGEPELPEGGRAGEGQVGAAGSTEATTEAPIPDSEPPVGEDVSAAPGAHGTVAPSAATEEGS